MAQVHGKFVDDGCYPQGFILFIRRAAKGSHERRQRRRSGKQSLLSSQAPETGGRACYAGRQTGESRRAGHAFIGVSQEGRQDWVHITGLASRNNWQAWVIGLVSSCLVPGPRPWKADEYCQLGCMGQREEVRSWTG